MSSLVNIKWVVRGAWHFNASLPSAHLDFPIASSPSVMVGVISGTAARFQTFIRINILPLSEILRDIFIIIGRFDCSAVHEGEFWRIYVNNSLSVYLNLKIFPADVQRFQKRNSHNSQLLEKYKMNRVRDYIFGLFPFCEGTLSKYELERSSSTRQ